MAETSVPFRAGREGYASFRIPAVVATSTGTLLAFCEGRVGSHDDFGNIDIVLKRSTDGGRTWGPLQVAAKNGDDLAGNPAPVVLDTGRILLVHVRNAALATESAIRRGVVSAADGRRVWVQHSDDEGATWSAPTGSPPTCSTCIRRSRSTATSAPPRGSPRCCCRATTASCTCFRRCRRPGRPGG